MDENSRRWFLFLMIALAIVYVHSFSLQRRKQAEAERAATASAETSGETLTSPTLVSEVSPATTSSVTTQTASSLSASPQEAERTAIAEAAERAAAKEILVETDTFRITFTTAGAYPTHWEIVDRRFATAAQSDVDKARQQGRKLKVGDFRPIELIPEYNGLGRHRQYPLMIVLKEAGGRFFDSFNVRNYEADPVRVEADGSRVLAMRSPVTPEGLRLVKTFRFPKRGFLCDLRIELQHLGDAKGQNLDFAEPLQPGLGLLWGPGIGEPQLGRIDARYYRIAAYDGERIFSDQFRSWPKALEDVAVEETYRSLRWLMLDSRFYLAAVLPAGDIRAPLGRAVVKPQHVPRSEDARREMSPPYSIEVYSQGFLLKPGQSRVFDYRVFTGPKDRDVLSEVDKEYSSENLDLRKILFYPIVRMQPFHWIVKDIVRPLALFMLALMGWFYSLTGSHGVAIILVVLVMRLITQPLTHIGMKSQAHVMAEQKRIKPLIDAINEKFKDDPQKRNAEIWKTYREHGVNPLGMLKGCFWIFFQMPFFLAMYALIVGAVDLRGAGFLWIEDLTAEDALFSWSFAIPFIGTHFNLIPILMGVSQVFAQRLQSVNIEDPTQKQMATMMPIVMTVFLYRFASALNLYWFISNLWQIVFQVFVNKRVREEAERKAIKAFEERRAAVQAGTFKAQPAKPGWREKMMKYLEKKAKETEDAKRRKGR
ncbi:YidC/Oxa1 family insertase periplasmic-domain containing protein [Candidatus Sumerlaeota bacterium]|nr:YidC/Oxa1 family insertase periplasmic-domain containing protein [Candidatus Sumerlaeota bacterium]